MKKEKRLLVNDGWNISTEGVKSVLQKTSNLPTLNLNRFKPKLQAQSNAQSNAQNIHTSNKKK